MDFETIRVERADGGLIDAPGRRVVGPKGKIPALSRLSPYGDGI
jgi:hypothetical protein